MQKTVIGSFDTFEDAHRSTRALRDAGFPAHDISLIGNSARGDYTTDGTVRVTASDETSGAATGAAAGSALGGAAGLAVSLLGLAIPGVGPILAAGPIAAALAGAGAGAVAGGLIGTLTDLGVADADAEIHAENIRRGGALVTVLTDSTRTNEAESILRDEGAIDIAGRVEQWRSSGWQGYDPKAAPYTFDDIERDRARYRAASWPGTH